MFLLRSSINQSIRYLRLYRSLYSNIFGVFSFLIFAFGGCRERWEPHKGIAGNEKADEWAKIATEEAICHSEEATRSGPGAANHSVIDLLQTANIELS